MFDERGKMVNMASSAETWHRLRDWQGGQPDEERLAAQILAADGYESLDPSHPLGGPDRGQDARCKKNDQLWIMAVYFARGEKPFKEIRDKLSSDIESARKHAPHGVAFVTNQELRLAERAQLQEYGGDLEVDIFHLERIAHVLDQPAMGPVREQYLGIPVGLPPMIITTEVLGVARRHSDDEFLRDRLVRAHEKSVRRNEAELRSPSSSVSAFDSILPNVLSGHTERARPRRTKPWTEAEIDEHMQQYGRELTGRWDSCLDYLASVAWPALHFRLTNEAKAFLKNVEIILTFHRAAGLNWIPPDNFYFGKLVNPKRMRPGPTAYQYYDDSLTALRPKDYPVDWENKGENLVVTITLRELRPHPAKELDMDDVVLIVRDPNADNVTVTWTATAEGYGDYLEGTPIVVPVENVDAYDSAHFAEGSAEDTH